MVCWAMRPLGTRETILKVRGGGPPTTLWAQARHRALSRRVTLFEPPMWIWLPEAINGLLGHEALVYWGQGRL